MTKNETDEIPSSRFLQTCDLPGQAFAPEPFTLVIFSGTGDLTERKLLVTGKNKASVVKKIIVREDHFLPTSLVQLEKGPLLFVLDKQASSLLNGQTQRERDE